MTDRELMQQALEALEDAHTTIERYQDVKARIAAMAALRERLARQEQERKWTLLLVGTQNGSVGEFGDTFEGHPAHYERVNVYTAPPPAREWQGLTDDEIGLLTTGDEWAHLETPALALFARAIEAKLKERNHA